MPRCPDCGDPLGIPLAVQLPCPHCHKEFPRAFILLEDLENIIEVARQFCRVPDKLPTGCFICGETPCKCRSA